MSIQFKRSTVEEGAEGIYDNTVHSLAVAIGGTKNDSYKITVTVKADRRELAKELARRFESTLRSIKREMKLDPNQVGLPLGEDEEMDEETGEIVASETCTTTISVGDGEPVTVNGTGAKAMKDALLKAGAAEVIAEAVGMKKPSRFKMPERTEKKKKSGKLPRATVTTN